MSSIEKFTYVRMSAFEFRDIVSCIVAVSIDPHSHTETRNRKIKKIYRHKVLILIILTLFDRQFYKMMVKFFLSFDLLSSLLLLL